MNYKQISCDTGPFKTMSEQKTLYILRHAKAETGAPSQDDHQRVLNERGIEACDIMGKYLHRHHILPERVLCSTAERTSETWMRIQESYPRPPLVEYSEQLYLASANEILKIIAQVPDSVNSLLVVGHNPGLHQLSLKLAKAGDEKLLDILVLKFPTCSLATIGFSGTWADLAKARGELKGFVTPKMLSSVAVDD